MTGRNFRQDLPDAQDFFGNRALMPQQPALLVIPLHLREWRPRISVFYHVRIKNGEDPLPFVGLPTKFYL